MSSDEDERSFLASTSSSTLNSDLLQRKKKELCLFYVKVGSCRHGLKCSRAHVRPTHSRTILLQNFYPEFISPNSGGSNLLLKDGDKLTSNNFDDEQKYFEEFYSEVFLEISKRYGKIRKLYISQNISNHMRGNVYAQFQHEANAKIAVHSLNSRWFAGMPIYAELSPVNNFRVTAICRQFKLGYCNRGNLCNFLHLRPISLELKRRLKCQVKKECKMLKIFNKKSNYLTKTNEKNSLPQSYYNNIDSSNLDSDTFDDTKTETTTISKNESSDESNFLSQIPKAFQKRKKTTFSDSEMSDHEFKIVQKTRQLIRHQRWQLLRRKLLLKNINETSLTKKDEEWNETQEQNFVFSLL